MDALALSCYLKDGLVGPPKIYSGAKINKYQVRSGKYHWSMLITPYVENATKTVEGLLKDEDKKLRRVKSDEKQTLPNGYKPDLEQSDDPILELAFR